MSKLRSASSIETEIQALLSHYRTPDLAADALIKKYENEKLNLAEFEALATFLLRCGFFATLTDLVIRKIGDGSTTPWGHLTEALFLSVQDVPESIQKALTEGSNSQKQLTDLARSHAMDQFNAKMPAHRLARRQRWIEKANKKKKEIIEQIAVLKSQGLHQEEDRQIQLLSRMFPGDMEIYQLRVSLRDRLAEEYIARRPEGPRREIFFPRFEELSEEEKNILSNIENSMHDALGSAPELAADFALAHMIWENCEASLRLLEKAPATETREWLRAEVLLRGRRFVELLEVLLQLESSQGDDPEAVFAIHYLRAQALWGLEQKKLAIEILEGMLSARPHYRAATSLLKEWKEDLL